MKNILYIVFTLAATVTVHAQKQVPPPGGTPRDFRLPAKKQTTLPNGMRTTLVQYGTMPKAYVVLIIKTGNVHEAAGQVWLPDLLGSLLHEGTTTVSSAALARKMAAIGGELTITTEADQVTIEGSALSEYTADLVRIIADVAINPALPASEIDRLKNDLKRTLSVSKTVSRSIASEKFMHAMYGNTPYGNLYPTEEMLNSYTIDNVTKFYRDNFGAKRAVLYVIGRFNEAAAAVAAAESFSKWKPGADPVYPSVDNNAVAASIIIDRKKAPQTTILLGLRSITPKDPDYLAYSLMNSLLGGSGASRIVSNIREQKGYSYAPRSNLSIHPNAAAWYEQADVTSEHTIDAINEIRKEIVRLQQEVPDPKELLNRQRFVAGDFVLQNSTPGGIINQLNFLDLHGLSDSYLSNYVKNIYAVTPQQVTDMAKKYLPINKMVLVMVGDEASIKEQQSKAAH
jgi:zinc protease